jgi:very-short-patch-repair endonuclease
VTRNDRTTSKAEPIPPQTDGTGHLLDRVARPQHGLVTSRQLRGEGLSTARQNTLVRQGVIIPVHRTVYRTAGTVLTTRHRLVAACLAAGGLVGASHRAGLWAWDLADGDPPIEVTVATVRRPVHGSIIVHRSQDLVQEHLTVRRGVSVTTPARTLVDVGCVVPPAVLATAVERALHRRLVTVAELRAMIDVVAGRGRNGVGVLRTLLDERALGDARPESLLEPLLARLCARNNVANVQYQCELVLDGRRLRPDFLIPDAKLVIEVDGLAVHGTRDALDHDLERQNLLTAYGYQVLRYTSTHLRSPDRIAAQILRTAARRRAELGLQRRG